MSVNNRVDSNIGAEKPKIESTTGIELYEIKADHVKILDSSNMKISAITSNKPTTSIEQPSADITKWSLLKQTEKYSHAPQFTNHMYSMNLEGDTLLQLQNFNICHSFCLLPIPIKKYLDCINISQSSIL